MDPFLIAKSLSLDYVRKVQAKLVGDDPQTYHKFIDILKQFRHRNIHSSFAVETINNLFRHHHSDLVLDFQRHFVPATYAAGAADQADSVEFLNRVEACFKLGRSNHGVYKEFLELMEAYSRGELTVHGARDRVVGLFNKHRHQDLAAEFVSSFLPESCKEAAVEHPPPNKRRRVGSSRETVEEKYFKVEDELTYVDVQIGNLQSTYDQALKLTSHLCRRDRSSPADVRLEEHFLPLSLICIKKLCKENNTKEENICSVMPQLTKLAAKKIKALDRSRERLVSTMTEYQGRLHDFL